VLYRYRYDLHRWLPSYTFLCTRDSAAGPMSNLPHLLFPIDGLGRSATWEKWTGNSSTRSLAMICFLVEYFLCYDVLYILYIVVRFYSSKLKVVATTEPCSMLPPGQLPAAPWWSMTAPHIMCIRLLPQLLWIVNPLCKSGTIFSSDYIAIQETNSTCSSASWWSYWSINHKTDHCAVY